MVEVIRGKNPTLQYISELLALFQTEAITIPTDYRTRVIESKKLLSSDTSGLVSTMLNFAVTCALVDYRIESDNENLQGVLNDWLKTINYSHRGKIPTGLEALAKEYFRERWLGSSNLLLRTFWEEKEGLSLPLTLFFVDGEDIKVVYNKNEPVRLGEEEYALRVDGNISNDIKLPRTKDEMIFVQRPFSSWGDFNPAPYIVKKGLYHNLAFYNLLSEKGEFIVARALEYLFVIKKGSEKLALDGRAEFTYSEEDLKGIRDDLKKILLDKKNEQGTPLYTSNFDTDLQHLIPEYEKAVNQAIYDPIEKRLLAGLGLVNIVEGVGASRRESMLNPKPFIEEVRQGIKDFKALLNDIIQTIIEKNQSSHRKWMNAKIEINNNPIKAFLTDKTLSTMRSIYDRGRLSSRSLVEIVADMDYDLEVERRKMEKEKGEDDILYPPIIQNFEQHVNDLKNQPKIEKDVNKNDTVRPDDKKSLEQKNFNLSNVIQCKECEHEGTVEEFTEFLEFSEINDNVLAICPECDKELGSDDILIISKIIGQPVDPRRDFEQAPYQTNKDLPPQLKSLPAKAKTVWRTVFNENLGKGEDVARKIAWTAVKNGWEKDKNGKWIKKTEVGVSSEGQK